MEIFFFELYQVKMNRGFIVGGLVYVYEFPVVFLNHLKTCGQDSTLAPLYKNNNNNVTKEKRHHFRKPRSFSSLTKWRTLTFFLSASFSCASQHIHNGVQ